MIVTVQIRGLFLIDAGNTRGPWSVYAVKSMSAVHTRGLAIYRHIQPTPQTKNLIDIWEGDLIQPIVRMELTGIPPLPRLYQYNNPARSQLSGLNSADLGNCLQLQDEIYKRPVGVDPSMVQSAIQISGGTWTAQGSSRRAIDVILINEPGKAIASRKLADFIQIEYDLDRFKNTLTVAGAGARPITFKPGETGYATISIKNYEPVGQKVSENHLGDIYAALASPRPPAIRFSRETEDTMSDSPGWLYPNKRPPANCPSVFLTAPLVQPSPVVRESHAG